MIPVGFCIDLETTIAGRIPDNIRPAGQKRFETRIIEIGAVHWKDRRRQFKCLVNPIPKHSLLKNPEDLFSLLRSMHQKPDATLDFWSSVLVKRNSLNNNMFLHDEPPEIWRNRTVTNRAKDFIRWYNNPDIGPTFKTENQALNELIQFTRAEPTWLAHNGRSFDFKVLEGCAERTNTVIPNAFNMVDTLHLFRKHLPGHGSYSQPKLYAKIFQRNYNAHVAIDDAKALAELCAYTDSKLQSSLKIPMKTPMKIPMKIPMKTPMKIPMKTPMEFPLKIPMDLTFVKRTSVKIHSKIPMERTFVKGKPVRSLRGIGPKTELALMALNITTVEQLKNNYNKHGVTWLRANVPKGVRWRVIIAGLKSAF